VTAVVGRAESVLDYPLPDLDSDIWDMATGRMREPVRMVLINFLDTFFEGIGYDFPPEWVKKVKVIGSMTSNQFTKDTDLDVHLETDYDMFAEDVGVEREFVHKILNKDVRKWMMQTAADIRLFGERPADFYFEDGRQEEVPSDGEFNLLDGVWDYEPRVLGAGNVPLQVYMDTLDRADAVASEFDELFGRANRAVGEIEKLKYAIEKWSTKEGGEGTLVRYRDLMTDFLDELATTIEAVDAMRKDQIERRRVDYAPDSEANLVFKYLQRYNYFQRARDLNRIMDPGGKIDADKVLAVRDVISGCPTDSWEIY